MNKPKRYFMRRTERACVDAPQRRLFAVRTESMGYEIGSGSPIADEQRIGVPFVPQDIDIEMLVCGGRQSVDGVKGAHKAHCAGINGRFERRQIDMEAE